MIFGKSKSKDFNEQIIKNSNPIDKPDVKYSEVQIDGNLTLQGEVKHILQKLRKE